MGNARRALAIALAAMMVGTAWGQSPSVVSFSTWRPFVMGFTPVVGNGAVGGVSIDAAGVVTRASPEAGAALREARLKAGSPLPAEVGRASPMRRISLRKLEAAIERLAREGKPLTDAMHCLAGLKRIEFVFIYPEQRDVVLAGPAEGWHVDPLGNVVGTVSSEPVILLEDLLTALRTAEAAEEHGITCSIDPTAEGLARWQKLMQSGNLQMNQAVLSRMEKALGPQRISITGVPPGCHFARVLISADFLMKRLAMGFESAPVDGLPSYLRLVENSPLPVSPAQQPRWWLAPRYDALAKDNDGLAWQLRGPGVGVLTEDSLFVERGQLARSGGSSPLAVQWAESFTSRYQELSRKLPVFAELRNCIDLAVISAILARQGCFDAANAQFTLLRDARQLPVAVTHVPQTVASQARFVKKGSHYVVSVSGGIEINSWAVSDRTEVHPELPGKRIHASPHAAGNWWWD